MFRGGLKTSLTVNRVAIQLPRDRTASELSKTVGKEMAELVEELRQAGDQDYWNTRIRPALLKSGA